MFWLLILFYALVFGGAFAYIGPYQKYRKKMKKQKTLDSFPIGSQVEIISADAAFAEFVGNKGRVVNYWHWQYVEDRVVVETFFRGTIPIQIPCKLTDLKLERSLTLVTNTELRRSYNLD